MCQFMEIKKINGIPLADSLTIGFDERILGRVVQNTDKIQDADSAVSISSSDSEIFSGHDDLLGEKVLLF
jgi:hypothetical protein